MTHSKSTRTEKPSTCNRPVRLAAAALVAIVGSVPALAAEVPWGSPPAISTAANGAQTVFAADVDGDGDIDVLSASPDDDKIAWYENTDGAGTFGSQQVISTAGNGAWSVYAADLDGDGDIDVLSASSYDNKIAWYENTNGAGSFGTQQIISTAHMSAHSVSAADLDGDGDLDVLAASSVDDKIAWYENTDGAGSFGTQQVITTAANGAFFVRAADVDGDGDVDVLSASDNDDKIAWYENTDGAGSFGSQQVISTNANRAHSVFPADLDGDGDVDVVSASLEDNKIAWYENDGTPAGAGDWTEYSISTAASAAESVFAGDVDGDGDIDVLSASALDDKIAWYENDGTPGGAGDWTEYSISTAAIYPRSVFAADVDGDGDLDALSASWSDDKIAWHENETIRRNASFYGNNEIDWVSTYTSAFAADIDGDGDLDVLSADSVTSSVKWHMNSSGDGEFALPHTIATPVNGATSVFAADVDGDGDLDALSAAEQDDTIAWHENDGTPGTGLWDTWAISTAADGASSVGAADVDGDGDLDVVSASAEDDTIAWYENVGTPTTVPWSKWAISTSAEGARSVFVADVDGDGDLDVLSASCNDDTVAWYENAGTPTTVPWSEYAISTSADCAQSVSASDMDGDGDVDVVSGSKDDGKVVLYENVVPTAVPWTAVLISQYAFQTECAVIADVDGDGDRDVASASTYVEPGGPEVHFFLNRGTPWESPWPGIPVWGPIGPGSSLFFADVDGDGDADAIANPYVGTLAWHENRGGQFALWTTDTGPSILHDGVTDDLLRIEACHQGRVGDADVELVTFALLFEQGPGTPLTSEEANALIENLFVYRDDGSGAFEAGSDTLVATTVGTLDLTAGVQIYGFTDGDPDVQLTCDPFLEDCGAGPCPYFFVVVEMAADASSQVPNTFRVTHLTNTKLTDPVSSGEDGDHDIPLVLMLQNDTPSTLVSVQASAPPFVTAVVPADDSLGVSTGTNVTITYSERVQPATVTTSTFRLLDSAGVLVTAAVGLAPDGVTATLDPTGSLVAGEVHTVEVTSGVLDLVGTPAVPFTSRFETATAAGIPLPSVSDQAVLPSPPSPPPGGTSSRFQSVGDNLGFSTTTAGDLDDDDLADCLAGAPGYSPGGSTDAGAAAVYFGSGAAEPGSGNHPREVAEIVFLGESAHDRAGSAVAGGFDFDGDGIEDFLIGAEQVNRSGVNDPNCNDGEPCGPGKVYLILFKPDDPGYDRNPADGTPDFEVSPEVLVPLSEVGTDISGVVFEGGATGDQAGFAVAAGGDLEGDADLFDEIVIGSPGASNDDGRVYVVFSDAGLSGTAAAPAQLSEVGVSIGGVAYQGSSGERLGSSVALPGDVVDPPGPDLAIGAPVADTTQPDAGRVYLASASDLVSAVVSASSIPTQIHGDQACEQLGFAVAAGGDNRADGDPTQFGGDPDLLIGAPYFDTDATTGDPCSGTTPVPNAGRVVQTSARLSPTVLTASEVGDTVPGVVWKGTASGDRLGWSVARLGDVSGNTLEDIGFGAPYADPGMAEAGAVYVVEGSANTGLLGTISASVVGQTVSGGVFLGTQTSEHASIALAAAGDMDGAGPATENDFAVGSPGWNGELGTVHQVLESILQQQGECTALGCTVAHLATGAMLSVPPGALDATERERYSVTGLPDPTATSALCGPTSWVGKTLVGVAEQSRVDCDTPPCTVSFNAGHEPSIEIPTLANLAYQIVTDEALDVRVCNLSLGWRDPQTGPTTGTVTDNSFLASPRVVRVDGVTELRLYGAFFDDLDQDGARPSCDCDDDDPTMWAPPGPAGTLLLDHDPATGTTLSWAEPAFAGGTVVLYDAVRSVDPGDFVTGAICVEGDGADRTSVDATADPLPGQVFYYWISPENGCPVDPGCFDPGPMRPAVDCPAF